jgi:hypothetical protein
VHACVILFHYYKLFESPCSSLSAAGAACILMQAVASLFQVKKKKNTVESKEKLIMDTCTAQEGSLSALKFISDEPGAR